MYRRSFVTTRKDKRREELVQTFEIAITSFYPTPAKRVIGVKPLVVHQKCMLSERVILNN